MTEHTSAKRKALQQRQTARVALTPQAALKKAVREALACKPAALVGARRRA
jgi:hypothetical protein